MANDANRKLGMIKRGVKNKSKEIICISPWLDLTWIIVYRHGNHISGRMQAQKVHRRATQMIEGMEGFGYLEKLRILNLTTLETRFF